MRKNNIITIECTLRRETTSAYLIDTGRLVGNTKLPQIVWLPKSMCEFDDGELQLPEWLAEKEGLI